MRPIFFQVLALWTACAPLVASKPTHSIIQQQQQQQQQQQPPQDHLGQTEAAARPDSAPKVPGHNNATYWLVPKEDQLFETELLEIAPSVIPNDRMFFILLRGKIPASSRKEDSLEHLDSFGIATLTFSLSVVWPDGDREGPRNYTVPLHSLAFADEAHLSIRDVATGAYLDHISTSGRYDILFDYWTSDIFLPTGTWTFTIQSNLEDGTCLFAMSLTQWLKGWI
ncbi:hypothetical protein BX600DRAFT_516672 [Xylariales sp. PMI_506]|nr:hypothetical protein BX600DRAFT_516672 [Xylariales sp. PMI_506]